MMNRTENSSFGLNITNKQKLNKLNETRLIIQNSSKKRLTFIVLDVLFQLCFKNNQSSYVINILFSLT